MAASQQCHIQRCGAFGLHGELVHKEGSEILEMVRLFCGDVFGFLDHMP
jgi:hypothetical protein